MPRTITSASARRPAPLSIRLSDAERACLIIRAGAEPVSSYVKQVLFDGKSIERSRPVQTLQERAILAKLLATLGASQIASNIATLARAADSGSLFLDDQDVARIRQACDDVRLIHNALMRGLGKEVREPSQHELTARFNREAAGNQQ